MNYVSVFPEDNTGALTTNIGTASGRIAEVSLHSTN